MQTGTLELQALGTLKDGTTSAGTSGQVLSSTGTATAWINVPQYVEFSTGEFINNTSVYLYVSPWTTDLNLRSGDASNGIANAGITRPLVCPVTGTLTEVTYVLKSVGVNQGSVVYPVTVQFELWNVGYTTQGSNLGSINASIPTSANPVGLYTVGATNFTGTTTGLSIAVTQGMLLGVKFVNGNTTSIAGMVTQVYLSLKIV